MAKSPIEIAYAHNGLVVARFDALVITLVRDQVDSPFLTAAFRVGQGLALRHKHVVSLTLVPVGAPIPDARTREEAARYTRNSASFLRAGATVVWGEGFAASTIRSVVMAMTVFSKGPPRRIFAKPNEAIDWLAPRLDGPAAKLDPLRPWCERALGDDYRSLLVE